MQAEEFDKEVHASPASCEEPEESAGTRAHVDAATDSPDAACPDCESARADDATVKPTTEEPEADETTGASPGTAQACDDLGLNSLAANLQRFGIKPPGQS